MRITDTSEKLKVKKQGDKQGWIATLTREFLRQPRRRQDRVVDQIIALLRQAM